MSTQEVFYSQELGKRLAFAASLFSESDTFSSDRFTLEQAPDVSPCHFGFSVLHPPPSLILELPLILS